MDLGFLGSKSFTRLAQTTRAARILAISIKKFIPIPQKKEKRGANDKYTIKSLNNIIELYEAWDKPDKVAEYKALLPDSLNDNY